MIYKRNYPADEIVPNLAVLIDGCPSIIYARDYNQWAKNIELYFEIDYYSMAGSGTCTNRKLNGLKSQFSVKRISTGKEKKGI